MFENIFENIILMIHISEICINIRNIWYFCKHLLNNKNISHRLYFVKTVELKDIYIFSISYIKLK